jgi:hypothetical protein
MKALTGIAVTLCAALCAGPAQAAAVRYDYEGTVDFCDDSAIGGGVCGVLVSIGDLISGWAVLDATGGIADRTFSVEDVLDYMVGVEGGALSGATPENSDLDPASMLLTDADGTVVDGAFVVLVDPTVLPVAISADLGNASWQVILFPGALDLVIAGGAGAFGAPTPVPLPAAAWLFASALVAGAGLGRARAR